MQERTGIDLLVPGLLGPLPALREIDAAPMAPTLEACLSQVDAVQIGNAGYAATIFSLFGLDSAGSGDLPTAPFRRLADGGQEDAAYWLQASPVHLRPDGTGLLLFDASLLGLSLEEAQQLAAMVREHFGWRLELYDPGRWYLGLEGRPDLHTSPLSDVIGRNIDRFLPRGGDAAAWHAWMNEVQMLLHMAQVNILREDRGQLSVNGLWLHGGGSLRQIETCAYAAVCADEALASGLALAAGVESFPLPQDSAEPVSRKGRWLVVFDRLQRPVLDADPYGWIESVALLDSWFAPLLEAVRSRRLSHIDIYPCDGRVYRVDAGSLRRFWRRRRSLCHYLVG